MDFTKIVEQSKNFFATYIAQVNTISFSLGSYLEDQIASTVLMFIGACVLYFVLCTCINGIGERTTVFGVIPASSQWQPLHIILGVICTLNYLTVNYALLETGVPSSDISARIIGWILVVFITRSGMSIAAATW